MELFSSNAGRLMHKWTNLYLVIAAHFASINLHKAIITS